MQTILRGNGSEIAIGPGHALALIGTRIHAADDRLADAICRLDMERIRQEARAQVADGAEVIAVQAYAKGADEVHLLPALVEAVSQAVPLPVCILTENPLALASALQACAGRPLVGSISGKAVALNEMLPLAAAHGAAVIATAIDDSGVPRRLDDRIELMRNVLRATILSGVSRQDIILNPALEPLAADPAAAVTYLQAAAHLARIEQLNIVVEPAAVADTEKGGNDLSRVLLALGARAGVTCALADPAHLSGTARAIDLLLGHPAALDRRRALLSASGPGEEGCAHATA